MEEGVSVDKLMKEIDLFFEETNRSLFWCDKSRMKLEILHPAILSFKLPLNAFLNITGLHYTFERKFYLPFIAFVSLQIPAIA